MTFTLQKLKKLLAVFAFAAPVVIVMTPYLNEANASGGGGSGTCQAGACVCCLDTLITSAALASYADSGCNYNHSSVLPTTTDIDGGYQTAWYDGVGGSGGICASPSQVKAYLEEVSASLWQFVKTYHQKDACVVSATFASGSQSCNSTNGIEVLDVVYGTKTP